jgi:hypothetical protein
MANRSRSKLFVGAFIIILVMVVGGYYLGSSPSPAPSNPPDRAGTAQNLPAGPATTADQATTGSVDPSKP